MPNFSLTSVLTEEGGACGLKGEFDRVVSTNGNLASSSFDKTIKIWNPTTGALLLTLIGHTDYVYKLELLPNGNLASGSMDKSVRIWNPITGALISNFTGHTAAISSLAVLSNGYLASGANDNNILIWKY